MFLLISFVLGNNYCIETTNGRCEKICKNRPEKFDNIFSHIPRDDELTTNDNEIHNFYIADDVPYFDSIHNFIMCDPSIHLIYEKSVSSIRVNERIFVNSDKILKDVPILFKLYNYLTIEVDTEEKSDSMDIILEPQKEILLLTKFYVSQYPENLISISPHTKRIRINDKLEDILKLFNDTSHFILNRDLQYYCISDKQDKCSNYNFPTMKYVNSISEVPDLAVYIIVDTSIPQYLGNFFGYCHLFLEKNSFLSYKPYGYGYQEYVILHSKSIEMDGFLIEGEGNFTLITTSNISLHSTTKRCDVNFAVKTVDPFELDNSFIIPIKDDFIFNMDKKIHVPDYSLYRGPGNLKGMFEEDKYLRIEDEYRFDNLTEYDVLKEYDYARLLYFFKPGTVEIPVTWKKACRFHGHKPNETTFIYNDVHSFDGLLIDHFIDCNMGYGQRNSITIRPSQYLYLDLQSLFSSYWDMKFRFEIKNDVYMYGINPNPCDEYVQDQCKIYGSGNVMVNDSRLLSLFEKCCEIDENIHLIKSDYKPKAFYACVGQSSLEKCKSEIPNINSLENYEWLWLRHLRTKWFLSKIFNIESTYLTDKHDLLIRYNEYDIDFDFILTGKADITIQADSTYYYYKIFENNIYKNQIDNIIALKNTAKITYLFSYDADIVLNYYENPSEIDFNIYLSGNNYNLYIKYIDDYIPNLIGLGGECNIYVRDYQLDRMDLFKKPDTISFALNGNENSDRILYADEIKDNILLPNCYLCNTYDDLFDYVKNNDIILICFYKDIKLQFFSHYQNFKFNNFYFYSGITVNIDVPDDVSILLNNSLICISVDEIDNTTTYCLHNEDPNNKFIFDVKDSINIIIDETSTNLPKIEFAGPKHSVDVFPNISLMEINNYKINVHENLTIVSPLPQYLTKIFDSNQVKFSPRWSYLYLSEEGKKLFQSNPLELNKVPSNDENLNENILLAVGKNDVFSITPKWTKNHNIFLLQKENDLYIDKPSIVSYLDNFLLLNDNIKIISGKVTILANDNFTINEMNEIYDKYYRKYFYEAKIVCNKNENNVLHIYLGTFEFSTKRNIKIYDLRENQNIIFLYKFDWDWDAFYRKIDFPYNNYQTRNYYDFICYSESDSDILYNCPKYGLALTSTSDLKNAIDEYHDINIIVGSDAKFEYLEVSYFRTVGVYSTNEKNVITFPNDAYQISITEDEFIITYEKWLEYEIKNVSHIIFEASGFINLNIHGNPNCEITLFLKSDTTLNSIIKSDIVINVINNSYHLHAKYPFGYENNFGDTIEYFYDDEVCAYDYSSWFCRCSQRMPFDDVFNGSFNYNKYQIVLEYTPKEIELPSTSKPKYMAISDHSNRNLTIANALSIYLSGNHVVNEFWEINDKYYFKPLLVLKLGNLTTITVNNTDHIYLQLTQYESFIDLKYCTNAKRPYIEFVQYGNKINKITIIGSFEHYNYFLNNLKSHNGVDIFYYHTENHYCVCNSKDVCDKCTSNLDGIVNTNNKIINDPGPNISLRFCFNNEISSSVYTNEHNAFVDENSILNITDVDTVYQNIEKGIKIDNLTFDNANRLMLKPTQPELKILMRKNQQGPDFYVEVNQFLKLNVINYNEKNVKASRLYVSGSGELYVNNYPIDKITNILYVKIYSGVYIMCNDPNSKCNYDSKYENIIIAIFNNFKNTFNSNTKIIVFINSYQNNIDVNLNDLSGQKIEFNRNSVNSVRSLEEQNKIRFTTTTKLINKEDLTTELESQSGGGVLLENSDSDLFIVGFDKSLTIQQEGNISSKLNQITVQPMSEEVTIYIDESVDIEKQKIIIKPEDKKEVKVNVVASKNYENEDSLKNFIQNDGNGKVTIVFRDPSDNKKNGLPIGAIIGIVVGAVVIIAVIVLVIVFVLKKKKEKVKFDDENNEDFMNQTDDSMNQLDDSTF